MSDWLTQYLKSPVPERKQIAQGELKNLLIEGTEELKVSLTPNQVTEILTYLSELVRWNEKINLIGTLPQREILIHYFLDALTPLKVLDPKETEEWVDIGSGAGFPGLVLKIARPSLRITLIEANGRRVSFLHHIIGLLRLSGVPVIHKRFEELAGSRSEGRFDLLLTRALAPELVLEKGRFLLRSGGKMLFFQSERETHTWKDRLRGQPGIELEKVEQLALPFSRHPRSLVLLRTV